jgi:hypothetical protein
VDPKLAARIALSRDVSWISTFGITDQEPSYVVPIPGVIVSSPTGFQKVYQLASGIEALLPWSLDAKLTAFFNLDRHVSDFVSGCGQLLDCGSVSSVDGRTYGLELLIRRPLWKRLGGWLAYTLSRAERYIGNVPYLSPFDRTHHLSAVLQYDFGHGVRAAVRASYYTGRPDFPSLGFATPRSPTIGFGPGQIPTIAFGPGQIGQHRLPSYARIDFRAEKRWQLGQSQWIAAVVEFFNATLAKEAVAFRCDLFKGICTASEVGPIALPSIGLEGGWR